MDVVSLGFRTDLMVRRLSGALVDPHPDRVVVRTPDNPTFYWGNFVLFPHPPGDGDAERWLATFAQDHPTATHVAIGVDGVAGDLGAAEPFRAAGLTPDVSVVLTAERSLTPRPVAPRAELRPLGTDDDWRQSVELRLAIDDDEREEHRRFVDGRQRELRRLTDHGHGVYVGAFVDGQLRAGLGLVAADRLARYQSVETHPDFRRRGFASALLALAARLVAEQHPVDTLVIVADPDYVAIDLYRRLGFEDRERQVQWQRAPVIRGVGARE